MPADDVTASSPCASSPSAVETAHLRDMRGVVLTLVGAGLLVALGLANGGFFPRTSSWALFAVVWMLAMTALLGVRVRLGRLELASLAAFAALAVWTLVTTVWSADPSQSVREAERALLYLAVFGLVLVLARAGAAEYLLQAVLLGLVAVTGYALVVYFFFSGGQPPDLYEGYQLFRPVGYANATGVLAAIAVVLAAGLFVETQRRDVRLASAAALVPLPVALYLSASRAAWLALAVALGALVVLEDERLRTLVAVAGLTPLPALAVLLTRHAHLLTRADRFPGHAAARLGLEVALAALLSATLAERISAFSALLSTGRLRRLGTLAGVAGGGLAAAGFCTVVALVAAGRLSVDLGIRSSYWHVAWSEWRGHRVLGSGAGTFARYWQLFRPIPTGAQDAHSLYLETLAELGVVGLALLTLCLLLPLAAAWKAREAPLVPTALAGYLVFLLHAGLDWDWEMPVVTVSGLLCAAALLVVSRPTGAGGVTVRPRAWMLAPIAALLGLSVAALASNGGFG